METLIKSDRLLERYVTHLIGGGRSGCIINIASTHGIVAVSKRVAYGTAKAGVIHMTKMLAIEWADRGIRVNAVAPGSVFTPARAALPTYAGRAEERMKMREPHIESIHSKNRFVRALLKFSRMRSLTQTGNLRALRRIL